MSNRIVRLAAIDPKLMPTEVISPIPEGASPSADGDALIILKASDALLKAGN